jgi:hypothetical protein
MRKKEPATNGRSIRALLILLMPIGPLVVEHVRWHQIKKVAEVHDPPLEGRQYAPRRLRRLRLVVFKDILEPHGAPPDIFANQSMCDGSRRDGFEVIAARIAGSRQQLPNGTGGITEACAGAEPT